MESQQAHLLVASAAYILIDEIVSTYKKPKRWWQVDLYKKRQNNLLIDLKSHELSGHYKNFVRMSSTDFEYLVNLIGPKISKQKTNMRKPISAQNRLALTLRFLASGDSYTSLQYLFRISKQLISIIVPEVYLALITELKQEIKLPSAKEDWMKICKEFNDIWNFPHCLGSIDGKHIVIEAPINSGSEYYNYKKSFSIVMLAVVDANYNFLYVDVGCQGRISDGGVYKNSNLYKIINNGQLPIPNHEPLPGRQKLVPYYFIGDSAFALSENLMKPYSGTHSAGTPERIYNYRLSRARRVVENAFGIISSVFRVLRKPMLLQPEKVESVVMATVYLHNFLRNKSSSRHIYTPPGTFDSERDGTLIPGTWRSDNDRMSSMLPVTNIPRRSPAYLKDIRQELADYFMKEGRISWQYHYS